MNLVQVLFFSGLGFAFIALIIVYWGGPSDWRRRMVVLFGVLALLAIGVAGKITVAQLATLLKARQTSSASISPFEMR